jgi:uncharacterized protein YbjT (DUF2867 family)
LNTPQTPTKEVNMSTNRILVTGASGNIGRELVAQLKARGADYAVMSSKQAAGAVRGDFADRASLERAFKGFDTLFLLLPLVPNKVELAKNAIAAAKSAGIRHIVRSSGLGADAQSPGSLTNQQMLDIVGKAAGHPIAYVDVPESAAREAMSGMPPVMIDWFSSLHHAIKQGWAAAISDDVRKLTGHAPRRLADFAAENANAWK